jgi:hypothetical protein
VTILPNIDRRQLLISAPTVALAGIASNITRGKVRGGKTMDHPVTV